MHTRICCVEESFGEIEECPGAPCPFWEHQGCGLERIDFRGRPELAGFLTELRGELEAIRGAEAADTERSRFFARLNAGHSD
jgi:hypothetical protein